RGGPRPVGGRRPAAPPARRRGAVLLLRPECQRGGGRPGRSRRHPQSPPAPRPRAAAAARRPAPRPAVRRSGPTTARGMTMTLLDSQPVPAPDRSDPPLDPLEAALRLEEPVAPGAQFAQRVMAAVHQEAKLPPPIAFPWRQLAAELLACAILLGAGLAA